MAAKSRASVWFVVAVIKQWWQNGSEATSYCSLVPFVSRYLGKLFQDYFSFVVFFVCFVFFPFCRLSIIGEAV